MVNLIFLLTSFLSLNGFFSVDHKNSSITVSGDSSMHNWSMEVEQFDIDVESSNHIVESIKVSCPLSYLKSGKEKMDQKARKAMKSNQFPTIDFVAERIEYLDQNEIKAIGKVIISGISRNIIVRGNYSEDTDRLLIIGSHRINMENYAIEPPTAFFGMLTVEPEVQINFKLSFDK